METYIARTTDPATLLQIKTTSKIDAIKTLKAIARCQNVDVKSIWIWQKNNQLKKI